MNSDSTGRTIAMDVEPNYGYIGGYGRKTFLDVSILNRYEVFTLSNLPISQALMCDEAVIICDIYCNSDLVTKFKL